MPDDERPPRTADTDPGPPTPGSDESVAAAPSGGGRASTTAPLGPARPGGGRVATVLVVLGVVALVAAAAVAVTQLRRAQDLDDDLADRTAVATAAATFGEVYLTYDFDDPEANGDRVAELASPDFAEDFSSTRAPGIEELFATLETTTRASTSEVFVGELGDDTARALVVVDIEATSPASGTQRLSDLSFVLDLVNVDGEWLVDRVNPAPQPDLAGDGVEDPADPPATTTTTAAPAP